MNDLSDRLTACCLRNKMTRTKLADKLGVSLGTLKNWERGRTKLQNNFGLESGLGWQIEQL